MKQASLTARSLFTKHSLTLFVFIITFVPVTYSQVGINTAWTWKKGPKEPFDLADHGTMGVESAGNIPPPRNSGSTFKDNSGNLWLFGGFTYQPAPMYYYYSDLWKFNPITNNWTWIKGSSSPNSAGNYGTIGVAAATNTPGARMDAASWVDNNGNFWLFGGVGIDVSGVEGMLNDLWKFDTNTSAWVWISGSNSRNAAGNYGVQGTAAGSNMPPGRSGMAFWGDNAGNFWFYGGFNFDWQPMNDLWRYTIASNTWTWIKGSATSNQAPSYGTNGIGATTNTPGGRWYSNAWSDAGNNLYLFGGGGGNSNYYNDLWKYTPQNNLWTWINGDNLPLQPPVTGTQGVFHPLNRPGARAGGSAFTDMQGDFWLFGGYGKSSSSSTAGGLNDLWKYSPATNQWVWIKGGELNAYGIYGTQGVAGAANKPGSKWSAMSWSAPSSDFWIFGGLGYGETLGWGEMNDLWMLSSSSLPVSVGSVAPTLPALLSIYPNPATSHIWFVLPAGEMINASYSVVDMSGRTILSSDLLTTVTNRYSINVSELSPGNYIIAIKTKKGIKQASFIKH
jgi:N-acetylneuraminic acid mutarotase